MNIVVIGLGSNLGSRRAYLQSAAELIAATEDYELIARSKVYETKALGPPQPDYLNAAVAIRTHRTLGHVLERLQTIELLLGRVKIEKWGTRVIDLDILWATESMTSARLTVPHPGLTSRNFALAPLLDVVPELESEYAPALQVAGGRPERSSPFPRVEGTKSVRAERVESVSRSADRADSIADALTLLYSSTSAKHAVTSHELTLARGDDDPAMLRAINDCLQGRGAVWRVLVSRYDAKTLALRVIGSEEQVPRGFLEVGGVITSAPHVRLWAMLHSVVEV